MFIDHGGTGCPQRSKLGGRVSEFCVKTCEADVDGNDDGNWFELFATLIAKWSRLL